MDIRQCLLPSVHNTSKKVDVPFFLIFIAAEYSYKIKLKETWNDELKDKNSDAFKDLKARLEEEVM